MNNFVKKIKAFFGKNKVLLWLLLGAVMVCMSELLLRTKNEHIGILSQIGSIVSELSLSYIASFIFYVVQVYFPDEKKQNEMNEGIKVYIDRIIYEINLTVSLIVRDQLGHDAFASPYTEHELSDLVSFNLSDEVEATENLRLEQDDQGNYKFKNATVKSWLAGQTSIISGYINRALVLYSQYMNPRIIRQMELIQKTGVMTSYQQLYYSNCNISFAKGTTSFLYKLYDAGQELKYDFYGTSTMELDDNRMEGTHMYRKQ